MGAYNSYTKSGVASSTSTYQYFKNQPAFSFFVGFGPNELSLLYEAATSANADTVWVPQPIKHHGHIGLSTWYVRALLSSMS